MLANLNAFNIYLLTPGKDQVKGMREVKVLDIFDGMSKNFHPDGLFSLETFGRVGEERRNRIFSYIDLKVPVLHPVIYRALTDLKSLYGGVLSGKEYAVFTKEGDFEKSTALDGDTGYEFFMRHLPDLKPELRTSPRREFNIKLLEKYKGKVTMDKHVVLPAGMRDYIVDKNGKPSEDEINSLYRKLLSLSSMVGNVNTRGNLAELDAIRFNIQLAVQEIYSYITNILEGKSGFMLGKWASRLTANSTRNVITSYVNDNDELFGPKTVTPNQSVVGLYQYLRMILPLAVKQVREGVLSQVFAGPDAPAMLVDKDSLKRVPVDIDSSVYDEWMTTEGLERFFSRFGEDDLRHMPLEVDDHYLALVYRGPGVYRVFSGIDELPEHLDRKHVGPITYAELLYLSVYKGSDKIPVMVTRYPAIEYGSVYPGYIYLKSTAKGETRVELDHEWNKTEYKTVEYPIMGAGFFDSASPNVVNLGPLGADFDGDTCSFQALWTTESKEDVAGLLGKRDYYVGLNQGLVFSSSNDISDLVLASLTGD